MNVLLVCEAVNRKHGANGSFIDLYNALVMLGFEVFIFPTARRWPLSYIEALNHVWVRPSKIIGHRDFAKCTLDFDAIFVMGNLSIDFITEISGKFRAAKLLSFQTANVDFTPHRMQFLDRLDFLLFQSRNQMQKHIDLLSSNSFSGIRLPQPFYIGASCREQEIDRVHAVHFGKKDLRLSCFGSIQPRKGQVEFLKICVRYPSLIEPVSLNFFGPKISGYSEYFEEFNTLVEECNSLGIETRYWGNKSNYLKYMKSSDFILSFSQEEGLSTIIREALYMERLVVATDIEGNVGLLAPSNSVVIHRSESSIVEFFEAIPEIVENYGGLTSAGRETYLRECAFNVYRDRLREIVGYI